MGKELMGSIAQNKLWDASGDSLSHDGVLPRWFSKETLNHNSRPRKGKSPRIVNGMTSKVSRDKKPKEEPPGNHPMRQNRLPQYLNYEEAELEPEVTGQEARRFALQARTRC